MISQWFLVDVWQFPPNLQRCTSREVHHSYVYQPKVSNIFWLLACTGYIDIAWFIQSKCLTLLDHYVYRDHIIFSTGKVDELKNECTKLRWLWLSHISGILKEAILPLDSDVSRPSLLFIWPSVLMAAEWCSWCVRNLLLPLTQSDELEFVNWFSGWSSGLYITLGAEWDCFLITEAVD